MYRHSRHSKNNHSKPSTKQSYLRNLDNRDVRQRGRLVYFFRDDDEEEEDKDYCMDGHSHNNSYSANKDGLDVLLDLTATTTTINTTAAAAAAAANTDKAAKAATTNNLLHHDSRDDHDDDDDDDNNSVSLFQVEESSLIHVQLLDRPRNLALAQYNSLHQEWGIYSTIWDGGLALLRYVCDLHVSHDDTHLHHHDSRGGSNSGAESSSSSDNSSLSTSSDWNADKNAVGLASWRDLTVIDIGSGTGLVGLGIAAASKGKALVAVTDLPLAMPLLKENAQLNAQSWTLGRQVHTPDCHVLQWGKEYKDDYDDGKEADQDNDDYFPSKWLEQFLERGEASSPSSPPPPPGTSSTTERRRQLTKNKKKTTRRRFLITGADVIYRKSLFEPLLITLTTLWTKLGHYAARNNNGNRNSNKSSSPLLPQVDCLLACQSIRGHLDEFWIMARNHGFDVQRIAMVDLDTSTTSSHAKLDLAAAVITHFHDNNDDARCLPPVTHTEKREGRIWIIRMEKLPYTFNI